MLNSSLLKEQTKIEPTSTNHPTVQSITTKKPESVMRGFLNPMRSKYKRKFLISSDSSQLCRYKRPLTIGKNMRRESETEKCKCHNYLHHYIIWDKYRLSLSILFGSRCNFLEILYLPKKSRNVLANSYFSGSKWKVFLKLCVQTLLVSFKYLDWANNNFLIFAHLVEDFYSNLCQASPLK